MMTGKLDDLTGEHDPYAKGWFDATRALLKPGGDVHLSADSDWAGNPCQWERWYQIDRAHRTKI